MLGLRVDADSLPFREIDDFLQRGHLVEAVEGRVRRPQVRNPLDRTQRLELGEREIRGEPTRERRAVDHLRRAPVREFGMGRDIGRARDLRLVTNDEDAVLGGHEIGLDVVGAHVDRQLVGRKRVLGPVRRSATVRDDERLPSPVRVRSAGFGNGCRQPQEKRSGDRGGNEACMHTPKLSSPNHRR
jgi:hypothetical protein